MGRGSRPVPRGGRPPTARTLQCIAVDSGNVKPHRETAGPIRRSFREGAPISPRLRPRSHPGRGLLFHRRGEPCRLTPREKEEPASPPEEAGSDSPLHQKGRTQPSSDDRRSPTATALVGCDVSNRGPVRSRCPRSSKPLVVGPFNGATAGEAGLPRDRTSGAQALRPCQDRRPAVTRPSPGCS